MPGSYVQTGTVAKATPFDNATNSFVSTNVQAAIEEIVSSGLGIVTTFATATGTISTTSGTFAVMTSMTLTPAAGKYLVVFSGSTLAQNDSDGEIAIFNNGVQVAHSTRRIYCEAAGLLGAVSAASMGSHTMAVETMAGGQAIDVRYRATNGTISVVGRSFLLVRVA